MRDGPRKPICAECPHNLHYSDSIPKRTMGVMMHLGERFCTGGKKARRFKREDPKIYVPSWCPKRKKPCELRIYVFKSADRWWLHETLEQKLGHSLNPEGFDYALTQKLTTELAPWEFWKRLEQNSYQELLNVSLESHSVVEIDDGLKPVSFCYRDGTFVMVPFFDADTARKNKKEE